MLSSSTLTLRPLPRAGVHCCRRLSTAAGIRCSRLSTAASASASAPASAATAAAAAVPRSARVQALDRLAEGMARPMSEMEIASGSGSYLASATGERYLDFTSGIGVTNTGHCHPKVVAAAQHQMGLLLHGQQSVGLSSPLVALTNRMLDGVVPASHDRLMFSTTGAEAVENAMRLARAATGRPNMVVFQGGYHGRSIGTLSLTRSKAGYGVANHPQMPGVFVAPFPYASQAPGMDSDAALYQLELLLKQQSAPSDTAAVIVEPVLGEGGYVAAPVGFLPGLRALCDKHGLLLILDEVQTGYGRTGRMWAHQHEDVNPDVLVMAKGMASGLPLSAISSRAELTKHVPAGAMGGTYAANPVACAAALATLDVFAEEGIVENAAARGEQLLSGLRAIAAAHPAWVREVRGLGCMVGLELQPPPSAPAGCAARLQRACRERGLLLLTASVFETLRFIPPLTVSAVEIDQALAVVGEALREVAAA